MLFETAPSVHWLSSPQKLQESLVSSSALGGAGGGCSSETEHTQHEGSPCSKEHLGIDSTSVYFTPALGMTGPRRELTAQKVAAARSHNYSGLSSPPGPAEPREDFFAAKSPN